ncbi:MAG: GNAT family N-acetyltransferase [bacterium]
MATSNAHESPGDLAVFIERTSAEIAADYAKAPANFLKNSSPPEMIELRDGGRIVLHSAMPAWSKVIGWGLSGPVSEEEIAEVELQFMDRGFTPRAWLTPFHNREFARNLGRRGWHIADWQQMMGRPLTPDDAAWQAPPGIEIREAEDPDEWARLITEGFGDELGHTPSQEYIIHRGFAELPYVRCYTAFHEGKRAGAASLMLRKGFVNIIAASVLPEFRRRGVHHALISHRLKVAAGEGETLATYSCDPGSASQRNAERMGFSVLYSRATMAKEG